MTEDAPARGRDNPLELILALVVVAGGVLMGLVGWVVWAMKCDDACAAKAFASSWHQDMDAWQWKAQFALALAITAASIVFAGLLADRRRGATAGVLVAGLLATGGWFGLVSSG
jgi:hypothetical protein